MMRSTKRVKNRLLGAGTVAALTLTLATTGLAAQDQVTVLGSGTSDDLVAPPSSTCSSDALLLVPDVEFTSVAMPVGVPRLGVGAGLVTSYDIPDFPELASGVIDVVEIITFDAHTGRDAWPAQDNERVSVEFLLGGEVQASTDLTPDVADSVNSAWAITDLGEHDLPEGADGARLVAFNEALNTDSVVVASLCAVFEADDGPVADDTEVLGTTEEADAEAEEAAAEEAAAEEAAAEEAAAEEAAAEEAAAAAAAEEAAAEEAAAEEAAAEEEAAAQDADEDEEEVAADETFTFQELIDMAIENNNADGGVAQVTETDPVAAEEGAAGDQLAITGANEIAFAVIALGVIMLGVASKVQGKDPEDFIYDE